MEAESEERKTIASSRSGGAPFERRKGLARHHKSYEIYIIYLLVVYIIISINVHLLASVYMIHS